MSSNLRSRMHESSVVYSESGTLGTTTSNTLTTVKTVTADSDWGFCRFEIKAKISDAVAMSAAIYFNDNSKNSLRGAIAVPAANVETSFSNWFVVRDVNTTGANSDENISANVRYVSKGDVLTFRLRTVSGASETVTLTEIKITKV